MTVFPKWPLTDGLEVERHQLAASVPEELGVVVG